METQCELLKNKANFKAFKFPDGSVYYGEISLIDSQGKIITDLTTIPEEEKSKIRKIRQGKGIQIYSKSEYDEMSRYEGEWLNDKRHGKGKCLFSDNSIYSGEFRNDEMDGNGIYKWNDGCEYNGEWTNGKMDGDGEYKNPTENVILKGKFINNCFLDVFLKFRILKRKL